MANAKTVIIGLGKTGLSCARFLAKKNQDFAVLDSRTSPPGLADFRHEFPNIPLHLGSFNHALLTEAQELIISPGISLREPAIAQQMARGAIAMGDIELFTRHANAPIVAITGTNGKSTVTTLTGEMAKNAGFNVGVGGNLGTPALELLQPQTNLYVLELSSFQLETTYSLKTVAATVLNITPDHMDRYSNFDEYINAKQRIYQGCQQPVINRDDQKSYRSLTDITRAISFGLNKPKQQNFGLIAESKNLFLAQDNEKIMSVDELQIKGKHQIANALAALALGSAIHLPLDSMRKTLKNFKGLAHRGQWVAKINQVDWYNDSKGTNVSSTLAAIEGLGSVINGKIVLLAGGQGKQQDFSPLRPIVDQYVRSIILFGQDAPLMGEVLQHSAATIQYAKDLSHAVQLAQDTALKNDAVLLSPACASFDMFKNFEDRGEQFMALVQALSLKSNS